MKQSKQVINGGISFYKNGFIKINASMKVNTDFFKTPVLFEFNDDYVSIKKPDIDYNGRVVKLRHKNSGWYSTTFKKELPEGKFSFDEDESNEDELIAYY